MRGTYLDDRLAAIAGLAPAELARRIEQLPPVAAWMVDRGRIGPLAPTAGPNPTRQALAAALADDDVMLLTLQLLDTSSLRLVLVLAARDGRMERGAIDHELASLPSARRDGIIRRLADRFVIHEPAPDTAISLRPGIARFVAMPGRSFDQLPFDTSITSDHLASWVKALGVTPVPSTKAARLDAARSVICNPDRLADHIALLGAATGDLYQRLVDAGAHGLPTDPLGINVWMLRAGAPYGQRSAARLNEATDPAQRLCERGIIWVDAERHKIGMWHEVLAAAGGRIFTRWPIEFEPELEPVVEPAQPGSHTLNTIESIVQHVAIEPLAGLKTGSIGVKPVRDLAKRVGRNVTAVGCLVRVAVGAGLVVPTFEPRGRGRAATVDYRYEIDPHRLQQWHASPATSRWVELVATWLDALDTDSDQRATIAVVRRAVVADLLQLPHGTGIARDELGTWVRSRHELGHFIDTDALAIELTMIGLCNDDGPCGLTAAARILLLRPKELHTAINTTTDATIVVQADFSVIAPPGLDPAVRARIDRLCTSGSTGSVTVLRLDRERIGAAIAAGEQPDALIEFLTTHSSRPLPASIAQLIRDAERHQGGLTVASATTIVTADDVLGLAAAVKVKTAKLTLIAPTVAISPLPPAKVLAALRAKGLAPRTPGGSSVTASSVTASPVGAPAVNARRAARPTTPAPAVLHPDRAQLLELMTAW